MNALISLKKRASDIFIVVAGSFLFALAINLFVIPSSFGEGGVTGITIILYYLYQWSPGLVSFLLNGILLAIGYKFLDKSTIAYTIIAVIAISVSLHFTEGWTIDASDHIINALFGGALSGLGLGLVIRAGGTTAGSTILAKMLHKYLDWNVSYALLAVDLVVVACSYFIIGAQKLMLTIVMLYVATKMMDFIIEGLNSKRSVMIVSREHKEIAAQVNTLMDRGVTVIHGYGHYTKLPQEILYIVISKQEISRLKKIVRSVDRNAFVTVQDVRDVFGEGFLDISK